MKKIYTGLTPEASSLDNAADMMSNSPNNRQRHIAAKIRKYEKHKAQEKLNAERNESRRQREEAEERWHREYSNTPESERYNWKQHLSDNELKQLNDGIAAFAVDGDAIRGAAWTRLVNELVWKYTPKGKFPKSADMMAHLIMNIPVRRDCTLEEQLAEMKLRSQ